MRRTDTADDATEGGDITRLRRSAVVDGLLRWRYVIVSFVAVASWAQRLQGTGKDWRFFHDGVEILFGPHRSYFPLEGGLHFYANYPEFQIGPLSLLIAWPFHSLGLDAGRNVASALMTVALVVLVWLLERTARLVLPFDETRQFFVRVTVLLGGMVAAVAWAPLSTIYAHLDDLLVLSALVVALWSIVARHPVILGVAVGAAIAAKPWGIVAIPLLLVMSGHSRRLAVAVSGTLVAIAWLPFVIADSRTLDAVTPQVFVSDASVIHLFGAPIAEAPTWVRLVQLLAMLAAALVAVMRHRWAAAPFIGVSVRLGLDPRAFLYYSAGVVLLGLAWDLLRSARPLPIWTLTSFLLLNVAYVVVDQPTARAWLRLVFVVGSVGVVLFTSPLPPSPPKHADRPPAQLRGMST